MLPATSPSRLSQADIDQVQNRAVVLASLFLIAAGGVASWLVLPVENLDPSHLLVGSSLLGLGITVNTLHRQRPRLARSLLLVGPVLAFALALQQLDQVFVPFFGVLIVILNAAVNPL